MNRRGFIKSIGLVFVGIASGGLLAWNETKAIDVEELNGGIFPYFDGSPHNPADAFLYSLTNHGYVPDDKIDLDRIKDWYSYCESESLVFSNLYHSGTLWEVMQAICVAGRATASIVDNKWTVYWEETMVNKAGRRMADIVDRSFIKGLSNA